MGAFIVKLQRYAKNPILAPRSDHPWEDLAVFNPGAWYEEDSGEVLLLYRAGESHPEYKCFFGLAKSPADFYFFGCYWSCYFNRVDGSL